MSSFHGYVALVAGQPSIADVGASGLSGVLIGNESGLTVVVEMQNANSKRSLYPGTVDFFEIPKNTPFNGNIIFTNDSKLNNVSSWPGSYLQIDTFGPGEKPSGTYPMSLPRNSNIGNQISVSSVSAIINTTNAPGSAWLTVQPTDAAADTWSADNSGNLLIQSDNAGTLVKVLQILAGASPLLKFFDLIQMDSVGHIIMPNNVTFRWLDSSNNSQAVLVATAADEVHLRAVKSGGKVILADSNDTANVTITNLGLTLNQGGIFLPNPTHQVIATGNTILIPGAYIRVSNAGAVTGIIMTAGSVAGQTIILYNEGTGSVTFAAAGSNVRQGSNISIGNGGQIVMTWDGSNWGTTKGA